MTRPAPASPSQRLDARPSLTNETPGAPTKADKVRDIIRGRKLAMKDNKPETNELVKQWCITDAIERVGMSRSLATTYVKNNWSKV